MKLKLFTLLCWLCLHANAEILQDIEWYDSLGKIKQRIPNATFSQRKPAWLKEDQAFYEITGSGLSGKTFVLFDDARPLFKRRLIEKAGELTAAQNDSYSELTKEPDDSALTVDWVRWVPDNPIPLDRVKAKYGPAKCDIDDDMQPICTWSNRALTARLSDDGKQVRMITTPFTKDEKRRSFQRKFGFIPDFLK